MNINKKNERNGALIKNNPSVHNDVQTERKRVIEGRREKRREKKFFLNPKEFQLVHAEGMIDFFKNCCFANLNE